MINSPFLDKLREQKENLDYKLEDLQIKQRRLEKEIKSFDPRDSVLTESENELIESENALSQRETELNCLIAHAKKGSDIDEPILTIEEIVAEIKAEISAATRERDVAQVDLTAEALEARRRAMNDEYRALPHLRTEEKLIEVKRKALSALRTRFASQTAKLASLRDDVSCREVEVRQIESAAKEHRLKVDEMSERRAAIEEHRKIAEAKKEKVEGRATTREVKRKRIAEQRRQIRLKLGEAEAEQEALDQVETALNREEIRLQKLKVEAEQAVRSVADEQEKMTRDRNRMLRTGRDESIATDLIYERIADVIRLHGDDEAIAGRRLERIDREVENKRAAAETEHANWIEMMTKKQEETDAKISELEEIVGAYGPVQKLKEVLLAKKREYEKLHNRIVRTQDEIRAITAADGKDAGVASVDEIVDDGGELDDMDEEELRTRKSDLELKLAIISRREIARQKTLQMYKKQMNSLNERSEILTKQAQQ